jgi:hypothetical protein
MKKKTINFKTLLCNAGTVFFVSAFLLTSYTLTAQRCGVNGITFTQQAGFGNNSQIIIGGYGQNDGAINFNCYSDSSVYGRSRNFNRITGGVIPPGGSPIPNWNSRIFQDLPLGVLRIQTSPVSNTCYDTVKWNKGMSILANGNIGIGTDETFGAKLAVNGMIYTKSDIKVTASLAWPDYVFTPEYKLPIIAEYEKQIAALGYIPQIGAAKIIQEDGLLLGEMQTRQMEVMEIMLRYQFEMNRRLDSLETVNQTLQTLLTKYSNIDSLLTQLLRNMKRETLLNTKDNENLQDLDKGHTPSVIKKEDE